YYAFALLVILGISVMLLLRYLIRRALHHVTQYAEQVPPNGSPTPFQGGYFSEFIRVGCAVEKMLLRIRERDKHLSSIIDNSPDLIFVRDLQCNFRLVNKNFAKLLNMTQEQLRGTQDKMIFTTDLPALWLKADQQVVQSHRPVQYQMEIEIEHSLHTFLVSKFPVLDDQNSLRSIGAIATDITNIKQAEERLQLTQQVFSETAEAIIVLDEKQRVLSSNRAFIEMSGFSEGDVTTVIHSFLVTHPSILQCLQCAPRWQGEGTLQCFGNRSLPVLVSMTKLSHIDAENHYVILFSDISALKVAEQQLERLALYDNLTGLPNRSLFKKRLEEALNDGSELLTAVMFIDLDFFKNVNDTYGHSIGDLLLQQVADRLRTCVQVTDTVSRLGGDEFTVILRELLNRDQVKDIALRILSTLGKPYQLDSIHSFISASIGISLAAEDGCDVDTLISHADQAMYQAKERGRNLIQFFDATHSENEQKQHQLEELLREALDKKEVFVLYQPRFDIDGMKVLAAEALIRWHSQKYGRISPDKFIPIAEGSDLIINIGRFVLFEACLQAAKWNTQGYQIPISVNLSPRQLYSSDLLQDIKRALKQTGLPSHLLELEITETTVMENIEQVLPILNQICALGVKFSIDDFGTGYSSLMYLKKLPVDTLKIDRSFIMDIPGDADDENLVSAIIYMAHSLHLRVVAEGVETEKQQHFLREKNCDELQGFLLGRPDSADKLKVLVDSLKLMSTRSTV
ncbi:MAG: EAL domain-containing protein, partial [Psychromonas sp.]|nr:EAL domain-containing protein [Psychromonas sp.]